MIADLPEDLIAKMPDGCWLWTGPMRGRYGAWHPPGSGRGPSPYAHRIAVGARHGEHVHHRCGQRLCVNPSHLERVDGHAGHAERHRRPTCGRGHPMSGANLYVWRGQRQCRACRAQRMKGRPRR